MPKRKVSLSKNKKSPALIILILCVILVVGFTGFFLIKQQITQSNLSKVLTDEWSSYTKDKPNFPGGVSMQIISPKGNYFMSTGMGNTMTNNTHFRTASVSKTFTAAAIMLLQQQGLLNIDDKITDNIPGTNTPYIPNTDDYNVPYKNEITIRELLMHRAGIFDVANNAIPLNFYSWNKPYVGQSYIDYIEKKDPTHTFTFDELVGVNAKNHLSFFKPGSAYHYSDTGYSMLGKIVEQVSKKSFADFVQSELLTPNGLSDTMNVTSGTDETLPAPFVKGYVYMKNNQAEDATISNMSPHVAEGDMITTPWNLANWAKKLFTGQAGLTKDTINMMINACTSTGGTGTTSGEYGLGLVCRNGWYGHNGAHAGYLTNMMYNPKTGVAFVIATDSWNVQSEPTLDSLAGELKEMDVVSTKVLQKLGY